MSEILDILEVMPHRYPFLLIDRVVEIDGSRLRAVKNVTYNEPWTGGHFPGKPVMPGVLIVESLAQAGGYLLGLGVADRHSKLILFTGIDNCRFRRQVVPGDVLELEVEVGAFRRSFAKIRGRATVAGELVCEADLMSVVTER